MARGLSFSTAVLTVLIALVLAHETCSTMLNHQDCPPSSCGNIPSISFPFRLKSEPETCGDLRYNLSCENNLTVLYLFGRRYYVKEISYNNYTIRVVDSGILKDNYLSTPTYSLNRYNFSSQYPAQYTTYQPKRGPDLELSRSVVWMSCEKPVNSPFYLDTSTCNSSIFNSHSKGKRYRYVKVGRRTNVTDVGDSCKVEQMFLTSWPGIEDPNNVSCKDVHNELVYGFELSWLEGYCPSYCRRNDSYCYLNDMNNVVSCYQYNMGIFDYILAFLSIAWNLIALIIFKAGYYYYIARFPPYLCVVLSCLITAIGLHLIAFVLGTPCVIAFLIYKWRRRHLSMYDCVEEFLQSHNNLMPIRYSYAQIRKITKGFEDKLGEGGYGSVFKGKLRSGHLVAIKMLGKSKGNGQDFISEVATIGRIHHANVVQLIGFCTEGPKRALIYEFMPNGSLDKYIFSREGSVPLSIEKMWMPKISAPRGPRTSLREGRIRAGFVYGGC